VPDVHCPKLPISSPINPLVGAANDSNSTGKGCLWDPRTRSTILGLMAKIRGAPLGCQRAQRAERAKAGSRGECMSSRRVHELLMTDCAQWKAATCSCWKIASPADNSAACASTRAAKEKILQCPTTISNGSTVHFAMPSTIEATVATGVKLVMPGRVSNYSTTVLNAIKLNIARDAHCNASEVSLKVAAGNAASEMDILLLDELLESSVVIKVTLPSSAATLLVRQIHSGKLITLSGIVITSATLMAAVPTSTPTLVTTNAPDLASNRALPTRSPSRPWSRPSFKRRGSSDQPHSSPTTAKTKAATTTPVGQQREHSEPQPLQQMTGSTEECEIKPCPPICKKAVKRTDKKGQSTFPRMVLVCAPAKECLDAQEKCLQSIQRAQKELGDRLSYALKDYTKNSEKAHQR